TWDLRQNPAAEPTPEQEQAIAAGYGFGPRGPLVELGEYTIKIKAGDKEATQKVTVEDDNRITLSAADRRARHDAIEKLYAMEKTTGKDRTTIQGIQTALTNARDQWKKDAGKQFVRSEEHTSELQSLAYLVCRLLLEKKKKLN